MVREAIFKVCHEFIDVDKCAAHNGARHDSHEMAFPYHKLGAAFKVWKV